jgi:phospholipid N-methyltransferase
MSKLFTVQAIKNFKQTGSLFRSSNYLARKIVAPIHTDKKITIVELGAGDGIITHTLLDTIHTDASLFSYEINEVFANKLNNIKDSRLTILNNCVSTIATTFEANTVDFVVSSLPLANIKRKFKKQLLTDISKVLKPEGSFIQYQYSKKDYKLLKQHFNNTSTIMCYLNVPPAIIYNCKK